ncbi:MAG: hypothetical protein LBG84_04095 [Treponema sp.]|jgi:hypothetical protein|nr:hypothetical protein [Treponema sp.]
MVRDPQAVIALAKQYINDVREIVIEPNAFPTSEIGSGNPFVDEVVETGIEL